MKKYKLCLGLLLLLSTLTYAQPSIDTSGYIKNNPDFYAIIIAKNDKIITAKYYNHYDKSSIFNDQSLTKSICSILIGIAIDKGYITSVDEKVADFFPELKSDPDKRKRDITIRQLMNQASGFYHEDLERIPDFLQLPDPSGYVLKAPLVSDPGKIFHYNNAASHLLSVIITKRTGMDTRSFAKKFLFDPLGITRFEWAKMRDGFEDGSGLVSIRMRAADMLKIGILVLHRGRYGTKQIVASAWIDQLLKPGIFYKTEWGFDNSIYALCWYHTNYNGTALTYAMGWGGQFLIIIPVMNTVIMVNENTANKNAVHQSVSFTNKIFPLIFNQLK